MKKTSGYTKWQRKEILRVIVSCKCLRIQCIVKKFYKDEKAEMAESHDENTCN